jgi:hypothetical protein
MGLSRLPGPAPGPSYVRQKRKRKKRPVNAMKGKRRLPMKARKSTRKVRLLGQKLLDRGTAQKGDDDGRRYPAEEKEVCGGAHTT